MTSQARIDANRRNAQLSTGPTSDDGKDRSRRNALKHGLSGRGVVLPEHEAEAVNARVAVWRDILTPFDDHQDWLLERMVVESVRVDRCHLHEIALRDEQAQRAGETWGEDRRIEAEELAARLQSNPGPVSARLRSNLHGCWLMIERWTALRRALDGGPWSADQEGLALDLLGTPEALRQGASPLRAAPGADPQSHIRSVIDGQLEWLRRLASGPLAARDDRERLDAEVGLAAEESRPLALLRRYEAACLRRMRWAERQFDRRDGAPTRAARQVQVTEVAPPAPEWEAAPPMVARPAWIPAKPPVLEEIAGPAREMQQALREMLGQGTALGGPTPAREEPSVRPSRHPLGSLMPAAPALNRRARRALARS